MNKELRRLARLCGVELHYYDIWGERQDASDDSVRTVLGAMGRDTSSPQEIAASVAAVRGRPWVDGIRPVIVKRIGQPLVCLVSLRASKGVTNWTWRVLKEDGAEINGECEPALIQRRFVGGHQAERYRVVLPATLETGYHRLEIDTGEGRILDTVVIIVPHRCYMPEAVSGEGKSWGIAAQVYSLRSKHDWGIGDFSDVAGLVTIAGEVGAGVVGLSPLHALPLRDASVVSPYSPVSRMAINVLFIDVTKLEGYESSPSVQHLIEELNKPDAVDYIRVHEVKLKALRLLYRAFLEKNAIEESDPYREYRHFVEGCGSTLWDYAVFEAIDEMCGASGDEGWGTYTWPRQLRDRRASAVMEFEKEHQSEIGFFLYLQWHALRQLAALKKTVKRQNLAIGLYADLALGTNAGGAEVWSRPEVFATGVSMGAPPDDCNLKGQVWGLPPFVPQELMASAFQPFIEMLRFNMGLANAVRIDHVMSLRRLYWVPEGKEGTEGIYVRYPLRELVGIVALESERNECLVVGEDLGTVPPIVTKVMREADILSYRLLMFAKDEEERFVQPRDYQERSVVSFATHDLPTLCGYWNGLDIDLREQLALYPKEGGAEEARTERIADKVALSKSLGVHPDVSCEELVIAAYSFLARSASKLVLVPLEDLVCQLDQVNLPGVVTHYPSWCHRLDTSVEELLALPHVRALFRAVAETRA